MKEKKPKQKINIAILGQPNSGKSTLFNNLTGSNQHIGNWPGKTVEKKKGKFSYNNKDFTIVDLPGSYSLHSCSDEEIITRDYIASGEADIVCIMVDASQMERSMFMLADYVGIKCPTILIINMIDIAEKRGRKIDKDLISKKLNIPVVSMSASDSKDYQSFFDALEKEYKIPDYSSLNTFYEDKIGSKFKEFVELMPKDQNEIFSPFWLAAKIIEGDALTTKIVKSKIEKPVWDKVFILLKNIKNESLKTNIFQKTCPLSTCKECVCSQKIGICKFSWVSEILKNSITKNSDERIYMGRFDRLATHKIWGKPFAFLMMISGLVASFLITMPVLLFIVMKVPHLIAPHINDIMLLFTPNMPWVSALINETIEAIFMAFGIAFFVAGSALVFGFMEEVGYMARISYVFDNTMSKLRLQGKSMMPILMSFGCVISGATSARVIDNWGQRVLTIMMAWLVPCAGTWGVISLFGAAFFGFNTIWVIISLFLCVIILMHITARIFGGKLVKEGSGTGLIIELPPYHKPKWGVLFRFVFNRAGGMFKRAAVFIVAIWLLFWALSYSADGNVNNSIIYKTGHFVEPITIWFGLTWETFTAFLSSMMGKEAALGVLGSVFSSSNANTSDIALQMQQVLSKPEALAFLFAFFFNIPCFATVVVTREETHSWKWTLCMVLYFVSISLVMAKLAYHIGNLIF